MSTYTKKWVGGILLILLLLGITPLLIGWQMKSVATSMAMKIPSSGISLYKELQLTDAQKKQVEGLDKEYQNRMMQLCGEHCAAKMKVSKLLQSPQTDKTAVQIAQREAMEAYSASENETLQHILRVSETLTPAQKELFLKKFGEEIQRTCPFQFIK